METVLSCFVLKDSILKSYSEVLFFIVVFQSLFIRRHATPIPHSINYKCTVESASVSFLKRRWQSVAVTVFCYSPHSAVQWFLLVRPARPSAAEERAQASAVLIVSRNVDEQSGS